MHERKDWAEGGTSPSFRRGLPVSRNSLRLSFSLIVFSALFLFFLKFSINPWVLYLSSIAVREEVFYSDIYAYDFLGSLLTALSSFSKQKQANRLPELCLLIIICFILPFTGL